VKNRYTFVVITGVRSFYEKSKFLATNGKSDDIIWMIGKKAFNYGFCSRLIFCGKNRRRLMLAAINFPLIIDIILGVIILLCAVAGGINGLYRGIMSFLSFALAVIASALLSKLLCKPAAGFVEKLGSDTIDAVFTGGAERSMETVMQVIIFVPLFIIVVFILKAITGAIDPLFEIPIPGFFDHALGAVLSIIESVLVLSIFIYVIRYFNINLPASITSESHILSILLKIDLRGMLNGLLGV
jgi:uncharacterized membrane protein required for colicin V production